MIKTTKFKGVRVQFTRDRIDVDDRDPDKFYYEIQHDDVRTHLPIKFEEEVDEDFWGTMIADEEIEFNNGDFHALSEDLGLKIAKAFGLVD
ncbi:LPD28 domain-containing protein [Tumebacillus flagellatus]|uniref:Large polyvalent protein associated domain-containing protein n=1 Tax=Tumebacillus flagellatus TaxID=1157490 RepID=A0A074LW69_9BACL|nr:LPD28 domain-containing protein [Tumebacillus flagellatus]KEO84835.1 hypothetical protein EL26_02150 [Tumebacillus flagellatus]